MSLMNMVDMIMGDRAADQSIEQTPRSGGVLHSKPSRATLDHPVPASVSSITSADSEEVNMSAPLGYRVVVKVPRLSDKSAYLARDEEVRRIIRREGRSRQFFIQTYDGRREVRSAQTISFTQEGRRALHNFRQNDMSNISSENSNNDGISVSKRSMARRRKHLNQSPDPLEMSDENSDSDDQQQRQRQLRNKTTQSKAISFPLPQEEYDGIISSSPSSDSEDFLNDVPRRRKREAIHRNIRTTRVSAKQVSYDFGRFSSESDGNERGRKAHKRNVTSTQPSRRSERTAGGILADMRERGEDEIDEVEIVKSTAPKIHGGKEEFVRLPNQDEFRKRHCMTCDTCGQFGHSAERGDLIFCQGCTMSYHKACIGHRANRDHLVTKIGEGSYVLQCRRCVELARHKDKTAPRQGRCAVCKQYGAATRPFRGRQTPAQEQKDRDRNGGRDPIQNVSPQRINNVINVMFRCQSCFQAFHLHHLEAKLDNPIEGDSISEKSMSRFAEYSETWTCHQCDSRPMPPIPNAQQATVGAIIAWRPTSDSDYRSGQTVEEVAEDEKEYLIKWSNMSHYKCRWMPGSWVWGVVSPTMRKAFANRDNGRNLPKMRTEDAIPEDWLRIDIIFSVKYTNLVQAQIEEVDLARIKEVARVYVKFKGLTYEDAVWTDAPDIEETERYEDFRVAYADFIRGKYIRAPSQKKIHNELQKIRADGDEQQRKLFQSKVILKEQPRDLLNGELMDYQLEGVNWLLYQWLLGRNAILADEMGLGKTIQVISFLAALKDRHSIWPFLVVVPNATCANWRREIKHWAPQLRVVTYFGSERARALSMDHELFGDRDKSTKPSSTDLRCHIVVTSYEAASDPSCQLFFAKINWQTLVVDEGQRLKNDKTILYKNLSALRAPFRLLLTGTPLQNNQRELFNLLQFLDKGHNAEELEAEYQDLTHELVKKLHELIRPYFLRRTKAQVLTFLPPMGQVIVPVTMSTLQRQLYKNILGRNASLLKAIMSKRDGAEKSAGISGLRNVLMQLRKCLCHPFVYSLEVEERTDNAAVSHRRLVAASPKLMLLEKMLPKLRENGHRVLLFSQFLGMLTIMEDFLEGSGLPYLRLDGSNSSLEKQKIIDRYNAPGSDIFAMLLSTRAGGVGINLASADTVIILDPDFNPHQDIQAISRAHRIGQKNKVLVFKLMTRESAEEKIMQVGKRKMVLDHVIVDQMEADTTDGNELESILAFGAQALFNDEAKDITYDDTSIDRLLDRSQIATPQAEDGENANQENSFSFARIWQNDNANMAELPVAVDERANDSEVWDNILAARTREAEAERRAKEMNMGRGKRARNNVFYGKDNAVPKAGDDKDSDTDFAASDAGEETDETDQDNIGGLDGALRDILSSNGIAEPPLQRPVGPPQAQVVHPLESATLPPKPKPLLIEHQFSRVEIRPPLPPPSGPTSIGSLPCLACKDTWGPHIVGYCPLKVVGPEYCNLCGMAHYGYQRTCPHLRSETQVRLMLEALKNSPEDPELIKRAKEKLQGIKGHLVQDKRRKAALEASTYFSVPISASTAVTVDSPLPHHQPSQHAASHGKLSLGHPPPTQVVQSIFESGWTPIEGTYYSRNRSD